MAGFLVFDNRIRFTNDDHTLTPEALYRMQSVVAGLVGTLTTLPATSIIVTPTGGVSSTDAQAAIAELDTEKQPIDATLTALSGVVTAADKLVYATGVDAFTTTDFSPFARTLLDDANAAAMRTTLGAASSADLTAHTGDTANPHSTTAAQVGADPTGTAAAAIVAHVALADPHTQYATDVALTAHTSDLANPHAVTKTQVGLGNVDNTSDANKPVSTATQAQLQAYWRRFLLMGA